MTEDAAEDLVSCFPVRLQGIIKEIFTDGKIGISSLNMKVHLLNTAVLEESFNKRSFVLEIPYASKQLFWEIVFNDEDYSFAPDFEFTDDSFLSDPEPNVIARYIPTLANWNVNNPKSLVNVIRELLILYKKIQISILQETDMYSRLFNEYSLVINKLAVPEENIEVFVEKAGFVHLLINIVVNFASLPPYIQPVLLGDNYNLLNPCEDTAALRISFTKADFSRVSSDLQLSPRIEQVIGSSNTLHIPKFNKEKGLVNYVIEVRKALAEKVESVSNHFSMRKEYLQVLISRCAQNIVEYDNKLFTHASIFCEIDTFPVLVLINIGKSFPQDKPKIVLRSIFQTHNSRSILSNLDNYPYSPRWKPQEMIDRLLNYLNDEIEKFLNYCKNLMDKDKN